MYISEIVEINNYRNLTGKTITFNDTLNFLIGENNIGKTNILELINICLAIGKFAETDFMDITLPIKIKFKVKYSNEEIGYFEDNFDVDDSNSITLVAVQDSVDERINYYHDTPNQTKIGMATIRTMNILYYYAQRMPSKEVDFRKTSGSGKVLNYLIQHSLEQSEIQEKDILKKTKLKNIVKNVNIQIKKINTITGDSVSAYVETEVDKLVCRLLGLGDENGRELSSLGEGVQYAFNILLQIIEIIYNVKATRKPEDFEERLINRDGKKLFPLFLVLDEPEVHQHPYRQRSLIRKIKALIENNNQEFLNLLKDLFDIDGLTGQIFIATHSPNILLDNYRQFIRLYKSTGTDSQLKIVSGMNVVIDDKLYKHMLHNFIYLKEAMFSKCIIFVEGDTENGAIPVFAERMGLDMDERGIGVIKLDGADSVKRCMALYKSFGIKSIALIDKDKKESYSSEPDIYFTKANDYEEDVYDNFKLTDYLKCCKELSGVEPYIPILRREGLNFNPGQFVENPANIEIDDTLQMKIMVENKDRELQKLKQSKNAAKGAVLAGYVTVIPPAFEKIINKLIKEVK
ncbi:ATP-dependent endonuclease [Blautia obeum]|jgi:putative ATP-dependent endonuclease of OLD family|uniref:ATP-dependent endonuclease n=1 Tax=Blautia obeum TaxID=40520 RepID=A0A412ET28_9FIRM|nr:MULTISPECIES: AAA family ATPase [Blautia]MCQ4790605.1 AAA family ATPase [Blautia obeum]RGR50110.1 ATP-dependent endonuclease [Blautia obeum]RGZ09455.1 ATP-dependent endonuclease [Blautia obeum]RHB09546.1 ATP-dependent endonuclease [Blautia obeum]